MSLRQSQVAVDQALKAKNKQYVHALKSIGFKADGDDTGETVAIDGAELASFPQKPTSLYFENGFFNGAEYKEISFHGPDASIQGFVPKIDLRTL